MLIILNLKHINRNRLALVHKTTCHQHPAAPGERWKSVNIFWKLEVFSLAFKNVRNKLFKQTKCSFWKFDELRNVIAFH